MDGFVSTTRHSPFLCGVIAILDPHHHHRCYFLWDEKPVRKLPAGWWHRGPVLCLHTPPSPWFHHSSVRCWTGSLHREILSIAPISHGAVGKNCVAHQQQHCRTKHSPLTHLNDATALTQQRLWQNVEPRSTLFRTHTKSSCNAIRLSNKYMWVHIYGKMVLCNVIGLFRLCTSSSSTKNKGIVNGVTFKSSKILPCKIVTWCLVSCHLNQQIYCSHWDF